MVKKSVAPLVGAWIETLGGNVQRFGRVVAPLVGAWIETAHDVGSWAGIMSHPSWVRGLKLAWFVLSCMMCSRTPRGCVD